jgi:hypothetical protein
VGKYIQGADLCATATSSAVYISMAFEVQLEEGEVEAYFRKVN